MDRLAGKRPVANTSTTKTAEVTTNDAAAKKSRSSLSIFGTSCGENDPRATLETIKTGTNYYFKHVDELFKVLNTQHEVRLSIALAPCALADKI